MKTNNENKNVTFRFQEIQAIKIEKQLKNLDCSKASQNSDNSTKTTKNHMTYLKKQPPEVFCKKRCSHKLRKIHRKTSVPESLFK